MHIFVSLQTIVSHTISCDPDKFFSGIIREYMSFQFDVAWWFGFGACVILCVC